MKPATVLFIALAFMVFASASAQQVNRGNICGSIPDLTVEQQQKIDNLSATHQKKMDELRAQYLSEGDWQQASSKKAQMNTEMQNHYKNVSALLTADQKTWYDQNCGADYRGTYPRNGMGRGNRAYANGQGMGRGAAYGTGRGVGRGGGRARCRYVY